MPHRVALLIMSAHADKLSYMQSTTDTRETSDLLTVAEAARRLRISRPSAYRLVASGALRGVRVGPLDAIRVPEGALAEVLRPVTPKEV